MTWTNWPPVQPNTRIVTRWRSFVLEAMFGRGKRRPCRLLNAQPSPTPLTQLCLCCRAAYALRYISSVEGTEGYWCRGKIKGRPGGPLSRC